MASFSDDLKAELEGEVYFDPMTRQVYSVDASIFEITPLGVAIPKNQADLTKIVKLAAKNQIPITVRGAATGITGGCLGIGLVVDLSKSISRILEINIEKGYAVCEPGVVQDVLNDQLSPFNYRLGPDTSTGNRATLGGMLANNAAGSRSLRYGKMVDHIEAVELLLTNSERIHFHAITEEEWKQKCQLPTTEGQIYKTIWEIREKYREDIKKHFPAIPRRVSGYNLDELIKSPGVNVAKLIAGSEGTLGIVTQMTLKIVPKINIAGLCLLHFDNLLDALREIPHLLTYNPIALELIDDQIIELGRASPSLRGQLEWLQGHPKALVIVELDDEKSLHDIKQGYAQTVITDQNEMTKVWKLRKAGLGILLSKRSWSRAIAFLEDISVDPYQLVPFMEKFSAYLQSHGKEAGIYGHMGSGCLHIRPYINLREVDEVQLMHQMMLDVSSLLLEHNGALSGEHGDGFIRSWLNPMMFGENVMQAFNELKHAFDPHNLMNPGKIVSFTTPFAPLRLSPEEKLENPPTFLNFQPEGGFDLAVDLCNGNGLCRKKEGVMCPSFQVTELEFHSTRARAQALRGIIHGHLPTSAMTGQEMYDVMDLCLSCKGCKTECPSQVDMAKMKAEFLYQYQEKHGYPIRSYLFGYIGRINDWLSPMAGIFNRLSHSTLSKALLNRVGISPRRPLPALASHRFSTWFSSHQQPHSRQKVILFNDTFNEFNEPHIGQAAVRVLNGLGYEVIVPKWICCGRPFISKGMLQQARKQAEKIIQALCFSDLPIIGLEPSCILTLKDDYSGVLPPSMIDQAKALATRCITFDEFIAQHVDKMQFKKVACQVKVHGHCHQKALVGMKPTMKVLNAIPGFEVHDIPSGCCGMAGSFGYEKEHADISMRIGELVLFPAIRHSKPETLFIADGTSCRHQIMDGTQTRAYHLAEVISQYFIF